MSETKSCGNCAHSYGKDMDGYCACGIDDHFTACDEVCDKHIMNINGWSEITPDNVDEIDSDINYLVIATIEGGEVVCNMYNDWYLGLSSMAKYGGYYYIVLPELKIE